MNCHLFVYPKFKDDKLISVKTRVKEFGSALSENDINGKCNVHPENKAHLIPECIVVDWDSTDSKIYENIKNYKYDSKDGLEWIGGS